MWRERIRGLTGHASFVAPARESELAAAEESLGCPLPAQLRELLGESDGVEGEYGLGLIWPLARIVGDNLRFRSDPQFSSVSMPFDALLCFADAGNGDQFACPRLPLREHVFVWNHEDDSRTWAASSVDQYLEWWLDGTLKV